MGSRLIAVTIDTEIDKDARWCIADPPAFRSVLEAVPLRLSPLFDEFGVVPTYLLSPEVIEHGPCTEILGALGDRAELGTHLHSEFVAPQRTIPPGGIGGAPTATLQRDLPEGVEEAKLAALTSLFEATFGRRPTSFRAGRFGLGPRTLEHLAGLGYEVDSSVTPGIVWRAEGLDYRGWGTGPQLVETPVGEILELPVSIRGGGALTRWLDGRPDLASRALGKALGARFSWLRPSWGTGADLVRYVEESDEELLVLMFHNVEVVPGASPYAADEAGVERILGALRVLFAHCQRTGIGFAGLTALARTAG